MTRRWGGETGPPPDGRACMVGPWHEPPSRPSPAASCSSSTARTRRPRAWSRTSPGSRTRSALAVGTSRWSRPSGVVAPDLRLGAWQKAIHRRGRPSPMPVPVLRAGVRKDAVMKIATNYFEDRREALIDMLGAQMLADVIGYGAHRDSIQAVLRTELTRRGQGRAWPAGAAGRPEPRRHRPRRPARRAGRRHRSRRASRSGSQAPLLYTFDAIPSMPYDEADPPHLPVPWLNIYDTRDFLSFLAEPLFRRTRRARQRGRPAGPLRPRLPEVAQRVLGAGVGLGCHRDGVHLAAGRAAHRARGASSRVRGAGGADPAGVRCDRRRSAVSSGGRGSLSGGSSPPR